MTTSKPYVTKTTHVLPFERLSWQDFERLGLALLLREEWGGAQHYGGSGGERGRDIVAYRNGDLWYVQCKRVKECGPHLLLAEVDKLASYMEQDSDLRPQGLLFMVSCPVSANARDQVEARCRELDLSAEIWAHTDLDARIQRYPDIVAEFFSQPAKAVLRHSSVTGAGQDPEDCIEGLSSDEHALLWAHAFETPADLERQMEHVQQLLQLNQLSIAGGQLPPFERGDAVDKSNSAGTQQETLEENRARLADLSATLQTARKVGIPAQMLILDFLEGNLYGSVLRLFMDSLQGDFDDLSLVHDLTAESPAFRRQLAKRLVGEAEVSDQVLADSMHQAIEGFIRRPDSGYIPVPGGKYRRVRF